MLNSVTIIACLAACTLAQTADYCSKTLCSNKPHIACGHKGTFASTCSADKQIIPISPFINTIIDTHNGYRSTLASGNLDGFLPAVGMATMKWNAELAKLAELNVMQCEMKHDQCRNTDTIKNAGQNLAWYWSSPAVTPESAINEALEGWWEEYDNAKMDHINSYKSATPAVGHFTTMANDRNTEVGCGLLKQTSDGGTEYVFVCNYAQTNIPGKKVYTSGGTASKCTTGTNPDFPGLCSASEPIDPNTIS